MKYLVILILIFFTAIAEDKKEKITLGLGPWMQTQPYKDVSPILTPSPVLFFDNGIAYIRWTRFGVYFLGKKNDDYSWGLSLTTQPRQYSYKSTDSNALTGMEDKKSSFEAGVAFSLKADKAYFEIMAMNDILNNTNSWVIESELGYEFKVGDFSLYPSATLTYQSSQFTNYYYGVQENEATPSRVAYQTNAGLQYGLQTYITYPFTKELSAFINLKVDKLSNEAANSPIVNDTFIFSGLASLIYTFEY